LSRRYRLTFAARWAGVEIDLNRVNLSFEPDEVTAGGGRRWAVCWFRSIRQFMLDMMVKFQLR